MKPDRQQEIVERLDLLAIAAGDQEKRLKKIQAAVSSNGKKLDKLLQRVVSNEEFSALTEKLKASESALLAEIGDAE